MDKIVNKIKLIISKYNLHKEYKWFIWYYVFIWKRKKLLFYINSRKNNVVFGVSHRGTTLLDDYPMLKVSADEIKLSTIKRNLYEADDVDKRGVAKIVELCVGWYNNKL